MVRCTIFTAGGKVNDILITGLSVSYAGKPILEKLSHRFTGEKWHVILGRSGVGKTTLLHAIAGLLEPSATVGGTIDDGNARTLAGRMTLMAQESDLLPWLSVRENTLLGARLRRMKKSYERADTLLSTCGLEAHRHKRPALLSGGERQRVALARTLMEERAIVLMDEPFSALDALTRFDLQTFAAKMLVRKTVLMITHDPGEALRLADHLYVLDRTLLPCALPPGAPPRPLDTQGLARHQQALLEALHDR